MDVDVHGPDRSWDFAAAPPGQAPGVSSMVGYRALDVPEMIHRGLPSSRLTFIVALDDGVEAVASGADVARARPAPLVLAGLHMAPSLVRQQRGQAGVQLALHPLAARVVLGVPAAELSVTEFDGTHVLGRWATDLPERLAEASTWNKRFELVTAELGRRQAANRSRHGVRPELRYAWQLLERSAGTAPIAHVATRVGLGSRQLATLFHREVGRSPKQVAGLMRFDRAVAVIAAGARESRHVDLADCALRAGYTDQAHLAREFKRFAGTSPSQWIAEELRNVQDGGHHAPAQWAYD